MMRSVDSRSIRIVRVFHGLYTVPTRPLQGPLHHSHRIHCPLGAKQGPAGPSRGQRMVRCEGREEVPRYGSVRSCGWSNGTRRRTLSRLGLARTCRHRRPIGRRQKESGAVRLSVSIHYLKGRRVLQPALAPVIDPGRRDVRVAEPFLDLGDIGVVLERVGRGGRPQAMDAETVNLDPALAA